MIPMLAQVLEAEISELCQTEELASESPKKLDSDLHSYFELVSSFSERDKEALKIFIDAIATKNRVQQALSLAKVSA